MSDGSGLGLAKIVVIKDGLMEHYQPYAQTNKQKPCDPADPFESGGGRMVGHYARLFQTLTGYERATEEQCELELSRRKRRNEGHQRLKGKRPFAKMIVAFINQTPFIVPFCSKWPLSVGAWQDHACYAVRNL